LSHSSEGGRRPEIPDEALVEKALEAPESDASREAASLLLGRYRGRVYGWCYQYVRDPERAMDLAQDVLLKAYRGLGSFRGQSRFGSWLFAIARNRCLNEMRRPSLFDDREFDPDREIGPGDDPAEAYEKRRDEETLLSLIRERLDAREQEVLWLRCFERMPIEMITRVMKLDQASGARGLLQRARRKLRAALAERREDMGTTA
jgi:RNA polymerase sigma-70 factor (ECF subfamily)